jgi:K+-sensing histidine kinase KdpD
VNGAIVELCLVTYLTNAVKYADLSDPEPWVEVHARLESDELVVAVRDKGRSIPGGVASRLFERFVMGEDTVTDAPQPGLGLSFVRDTVETLGGRAWVERPETGRGSIFAFSLPSRRRTDTEGDA